VYLKYIESLIYLWINTKSTLFNKWSFCSWVRSP